MKLKGIIFLFLFILICFFEYVIADNNFIMQDSLIISEIYFDGRDEWIEIYANNIFSGDLVISGAKSSNLIIPNLLLGTGDIVVVGDSLNMISNFEGYRVFSGVGLNIPDTDYINIELFSGNSILSSALISGNLVSELNNLSKSIVLDNGVYSGEVDSINVVEGVTASPGYYENMADPCISESDLFSSNLLDEICNLTPEIENENFDSGTENEYDLITGDVYLEAYSGKVNVVSSFDSLVCGSDYYFIFSFSGTKYEINNCDFSLINQLVSDLDLVDLKVFLNKGDLSIYQNQIYYYRIKEYNENLNLSGTTIVDKYSDGILKITEINSIDANLPEYVELYASGNYFGNVEIIGLGHGKYSKSLSGAFYSGNYYVISDKIVNDSGFNYFKSGVNLIELESISLTNGGENLKVVGHSGHVMDSVEYVESEYGFAIYNNLELIDESLLGTSRLFDEKGKFSPGYDHSIVYEQLENKTIKSCGIKLQGSNPIYSKHSINLIGMYNGTEIQNSDDSIKCSWEVNSIDGVNVFTGDELNKCNPGYIKLSQPGIYEIEFEINDETDNLICRSSSSINLPEYPIVSCKQTYYEGLYNKWKDKYYDINKQLKSCEKINNENKVNGNTGKFLNGKIVKPDIIKIKSLLPDPIGIDGENENILFEVLSENLSDLDGIYFKGSKNGKKIYLGSYKSAFKRGELFIEGELKLKNSVNCVFIEDKEHIYDSFCYGNISEGEVVKHKIDGLEMYDLGIFNNIKLSLFDENYCYSFGSINIDCKKLKYGLQHIQDIKYDSQNKLQKLNDNYNLLKFEKNKFKKDLTSCEIKNDKAEKKLRSLEKKENSLSNKLEKTDSSREYRRDKYLDMSEKRKQIYSKILFIGDELKKIEKKLKGNWKIAYKTDLKNNFDTIKQVQKEQLNVDLYQNSAILDQNKFINDSDFGGIFEIVETYQSIFKKINKLYLGAIPENKIDS